MATCPYCSDVLLHEVRHSELFWFCRHCWTEIPEVVIQRQGLSDRLPLPSQPVESTPRLVTLPIQGTLNTPHAA